MMVFLFFFMIRQPLPKIFNKDPVKSDNCNKQNACYKEKILLNMSIDMRYRTKQWSSDH